MTGDHRAVVWQSVLVSFVILAAIYGISPNFRFRDGPLADPYAGDFMQEWVGGYLVLHGERQQFYNVDNFRQIQHDPEIVGYAWNEDLYLPVVYPPFYYVAVSPLALLPMRAAAWVWAAWMVAALAGSICLLQRLAAKGCLGALPFGSTKRDGQTMPVGQTMPFRQAMPVPRVLGWLLPLSLLYQPVIESLTTSQKGSVCLLILTGAYCLLVKGRPLTAGALFGLLLFKPQLTLVIGLSLLMKRQWRFVAGSLLTATLLVGISLSLGRDVCQQYIDFILGTGDYLQTAGYDLHKSHCLRGFFTLLDRGRSTTIGPLAAGIAALAVVGILVRLLRGPLRTSSPAFALQYAGLVMATILLSPHVFTYDLTILLLPMVLIGCWLGTAPPLAGHLRQLIVWGLVLMFVIPGFSTTLAQRTGIQWTVPLLVALLVMLAMARTPHSPNSQVARP